MGVFWPIIKNENVKYYKGIYNSQIKKVKKSYQENQGCYLSFSARAGVIYRLHDYFQLVHIGSKFHFSVCPICDEISAQFPMMKFLHVIVIPFYCFHFLYKNKPHYGFTSWNFSQEVAPNGNNFHLKFWWTPSVYDDVTFQKHWKEFTVFTALFWSK